jgi:hypothetical protein
VKTVAGNRKPSPIVGPVTQGAPAAAPLPTVEIIRGDKRTAEVIK